jgi:hypothetical protein
LNHDFIDFLVLLARCKVEFMVVGGLYARAVIVTLQGEKIPFIHPHDQITNKRAAGRPRDLADAADLVRLHGEPKTP